MGVRQRFLLVFLIVFGCISCDQTTKRIAAERLPREEALSLAGDVLRLQVVENRGAFLGLGSGLPEGARTFVFTGLVGLALAVLLVCLLRSATSSRWSLVAGSLVAGGGLGNLIDRIARSGHVVDFLNCGVGPVRTGIFNVADVAILAGVAMLLLRRREPVGAA
jgi:signal peptidase II